MRSRQSLANGTHPCDVFVAVTTGGNARISRQLCKTYIDDAMVGAFKRRQSIYHNGRFNPFLRPIICGNDGTADMQHSKCCAICVWVQIPLPAPCGLNIYIFIASGVAFIATPFSWRAKVSSGFNSRTLLLSIKIMCSGYRGRPKVPPHEQEICFVICVDHKQVKHILSIL